MTTLYVAQAVLQNRVTMLHTAILLVKSREELVKKLADRYNEYKIYDDYIEDGQENIPFAERKLDDWTVPSTNDQINMAFKSERGSVIVFPHQLAHDVSKHPGGEKRIIIRFDIFYQAVGKV